MKHSPPMQEYQKNLNERVLADIKFAQSLIRHNGERGRVLELTFQKLLERHLPEAYGVTTGFAIDQKGDLSKQLDIIVYSKSHCPFFFNEGISVLPVEAVILAVEVKSKLDTREFQDVRRKARSVIDLDRSAVIAKPGEPSSPMNANDGLHMPLILGVSLESVDTTKLLAAQSGEVIEPVFISMDGRCLMRGAGPDRKIKWVHQIDDPAASFVLFSTMMVTQSILRPIDVTKYLKVMPS
ncbi:DUF6602 domain-containing protein [Phaeobacter inhibens]|uniref:DUF6602 domain-containing protein n=1 Tax=Phaeobacter inhibens TaxID=221822 RepID=UPI0021A8D722|nr:DUF6602 domain-containing protein [Phaeobacter inhibens]UWR50118.1 hypothetical protein K4F87_05015 [Phaeobacter inhibens]